MELIAITLTITCVLSSFFGALIYLFTTYVKGGDK
ncbi:hypothetical protein [uncultured Mediterranean phage uvMED]|nr:hypothetical protein [uncultured Mediterranean phage uvMED]